MHTPLSQLFTDAVTSLECGTLYVVATPIGNLTDIGIRALAALAHADVLCAEDTRVSAQLLRLYGFSPPKLISVHEHNERQRTEYIIELLQQTQQKVVLVSDAGTPAVSDPGARLVHAVHQAGLKVCPIPGPSALTTAIAAAGLHAPQLLFYGFLPPKRLARQKILAEWCEAPYAIALYEAPHRLLDTLEDIAEILGAHRELVLARELTKTFETIYRTTAAQLWEFVRDDPNQQRGETVILIDASPVSPSSAETELPSEAIKILTRLLAELPVRQATQITADLTGIRRNTLYSYALTLKNDA